MEKVIWVFDFDNTLVKSQYDFQGLSKGIYELFIKKINYQTMLLFNILKDQQVPLLVLTSRHPGYIKEIESFLNFHNVVCRDFLLDLDEVNQLFNNLDVDKQIDFLTKMMNFKAKILNYYSKNYDRVMFIDDYASEFKRKDLLNDNVFAITPFYDTRGGNRIDVAVQHFLKTGDIR